MPDQRRFRRRRCGHSTSICISRVLLFALAGARLVAGICGAGIRYWRTAIARATGRCIAIGGVVSQLAAKPDSQACGKSLNSLFGTRS